MKKDASASHIKEKAKANGLEKFWHLQVTLLLGCAVLLTSCYSHGKAGRGLCEDSCGQHLGLQSAPSRRFHDESHHDDGARRKGGGGVCGHAGMPFPQAARPGGAAGNAETCFVDP